MYDRNMKSLYEYFEGLHSCTLIAAATNKLSKYINETATTVKMITLQDCMQNDTKKLLRLTQGAIICILRSIIKFLEENVKFLMFLELHFLFQRNIEKKELRINC